MPRGARKVRKKITVVSLKDLILRYALSTIPNLPHGCRIRTLLRPVKSTLIPVLQAATTGSLNTAIGAVVCSAIAPNTNCKHRASHYDKILRCKNSHMAMAPSISKRLSRGISSTSPSNGRPYVYWLALRISSL